MLNNPIIVIVDISEVSLMCHKVTPIPIRRNENSLIWPRDEPAKKLFFLVCHIRPKIIIVINGLIINMKSVKIRIIGINFPIQTKLICDPNSTKYITIKKSLNDLILLVISYLKLELDNRIPATNVPNSIPNHK